MTFETACEIGGIFEAGGERYFLDFQGGRRFEHLVGVFKTGSQEEPVCGFMQIALEKAV